GQVAAVREAADLLQRELEVSPTWQRRARSSRPFLLLATVGLPHLGVQNLVDDNAILDRTAPQQSFALESGFLQYPDRRHIVREHERENSGQLVVVERPLRRSRDRARCQSSPPEFLAQPVAHLRAEAGN